MSQYFLAVQHEAGTQAAGTVYPSEADMQRALEEVGAFNEELAKHGQLVFAGGLEEPEKSVILRPGLAPEGGPLVERGWQLGGFWIIEADDDAAALDLAGRAARACGQTVELRKLQSV